MPDETGQAQQEAGGYAAALEGLRTSAKWLLAAFSGIAVVLAAGLQLTGIGELRPADWRLWVALVGALSALTSVAYMATKASAVLTREWVTLGSYSDEQIRNLLSSGQGDEETKRSKRVLQQIEANSHELYGHVAKDLPTLRRRLREVDERLQGDLTREARQELLEDASVIRSAAKDVAQCASYYATLYLFDDMRRRLVRGSVVAVAGLTLFAYAVNPPKPDKSTDVRVRITFHDLGPLHPRHRSTVLPHVKG
ncbi:AAA family ATPase [Streptomyces scabiei]|uniref:hypothetical protein n=1 Tax=Streptomyces scabiei TaxID=1930 RepID=UPI0029B2A9ED|nr:hypothetical protein [Streptomyces scabiei]MDX3205145.1 hypothetical protein [Streptomyces scabiei]